MSENPFKFRSRISKRATYTIVLGLAVAFILTICAFASSAQAQSTVGNSKMITENCRFGRNTDTFGCAMVRNTFGVPPVSLMREVGAKLYKAKNEANSAADRTSADTLFEAWVEELAVTMQVKQRLLGALGNNAGLLIEEAWLVKLEACKAKKPCIMLKNTGLLNRTEALLRRLFKSDQRVWNMLNEAKNLLGNPA